MDIPSMTPTRVKQQCTVGEAKDRNPISPFFNAEIRHNFAEDETWGEEVYDDQSKLACHIFVNDLGYRSVTFLLTRQQPPSPSATTRNDISKEAVRTGRKPKSGMQKVIMIKHRPYKKCEGVQFQNFPQIERIENKKCGLDFIVKN